MHVEQIQAQVLESLEYTLQGGLIDDDPHEAHPAVARFLDLESLDGGRQHRSRPTGDHDLVAHGLHSPSRP